MVALYLGNIQILDLTFIREDFGKSFGMQAVIGAFHDSH